jgi:hypothetical protein
VARTHADADRFLGYKDKSRKSGTCMNTYLGQMEYSNTFGIMWGAIFGEKNVWYVTKEGVL